MLIFVVFYKLRRQLEGCTSRGSIPASTSTVMFMGHTLQVCMSSLY